MASAAPVTMSWQELLIAACLQANLAAPVFEYSSDRRGGRTAWSSTVIVDGVTFPARFWYDGNHLHNAKEDAAELAVLWLQAKVEASQQQQQQQQQAHSGAACRW